RWAGKVSPMFLARYSDPEAVATEFRMILVPAGSGAASNLVQVEPVDRMSAILVITSQPAYLERAREWISQLDHGDETTQRRLYVRYVQNGRAVELARVLRQALGISSGGTQEATSPIAPGMVQSTVSAPSTGGITSGGFGSQSGGFSSQGGFGGNAHGQPTSSPSAGAAGGEAGNGGLIYSSNEAATSQGQTTSNATQSVGGGTQAST